MRFGRPMVLWRTGGHVQAAWDGCPHRGATFDAARVRDGQLICPFHSFAFDRSGACTAVPCDGPDAPRRGLQLQTLATRDDAGLVWVWVAGGDPTEALPWFEDLDGGYPADFVETFEAPWDRVIETMLDYAHLPTVHAGSIGTKMPMGMRVEMRRTERGLVVWKAPPVANGSGELSWEAPASWQLKLAPKLVNAAFFVPMDACRTSVVFRFSQPFVRVPILGDLIGWFANLYNRKVVEEDRRVIEGLARTLAIRPQTDRLVAADAPIAHFRRARTAWMRGASTDAG
jgi:phenylpropionate dioxygenase-like ring-hydroxylating dioxygenase large terminal subunit